MGLFNWIGKQPNRLANYTKKVVAGEEIKSGAQYIVDLTKQLGKDTQRRETFENAYHRLNMTEEKLQESYKFYMGRFTLFMFFFGIGTALFIYFMFGKFLAALAVFGFLAVCLSQMFNASFRMMQIRHREMLPVIYWLRHPEEWWLRSLPASRTSTKMTPHSSSKKN